mgnify:CR=1 FL=1
MRIGSWMMWVLAAGLLVASCTEGPRRLELPPKGQPVPAFPAAQPANGEQAQAGTDLEVVLTQPTGAVFKLSAVNIGFNQPMTLDPSEEPGCGLVRISPPLDGTCRWLGPNTLSFVPRQRLPLATTFDVTVPATARAASGKALGKEQHFSFYTPGLSVVRYDPSWYSAKIAPDEQLFVQFNLPVNPEAMRSAVSLRNTAANKTVPVKVTVATKDRGGDAVEGEGRAFHIQPTERLAAGTRYILQIAKGLRPTEGSVGLSTEWAREFTTYGDFAVHDVRCGWGECTPDSPWVIEFTNPINQKDVEKCITVRPKVDLGTSYAYSRSVTFRPKGKPATSYDVTVNGKCKDRLGNALARATTRTLTVGHYPPRITMSRGVSYMELPEVANGAIRYPVTFLNTPDINLRMRRLTEADIPKFMEKFSEWSSDDVLVGDWSPQVSRPFGTRLKEDVKKTYGVNLREVVGDAGAGVVYLDVQSDRFDSRRGYYGTRFHKSVVQITDIGLTVKYSPENISVWTTSLGSAEPLAGVRVALRTLSGELLWEGKSNADGIALGPGVKSFKGKKPRYVFATRAKELSFLDLEDWKLEVHPYRFNIPYEWDAPRARVLGQIFTERGVYRPGEKVHVKGWLRLDEGRQLKVLPTDKAQVTVKDSTGNVVLDREVTMTDLDGLDVEIPVAGDAPLGTWYVSAKPVGDVDAEGTANGSFRVEAYRAPDFEVVVTPASKDTFVTQKAKVELSGQYLFGAPMAGAKVSWSAIRRGRDFQPSGWKNWSFGKQADRFWWYDHDERSNLHVGGEETRLSAAGTVELDLDMVASDEIDGPQELVIEAEVTDVNRQVVSGRSTLRVHPGAYYVGLKAPGYMTESGKTLGIGVAAVTPDGKPVVGRSVTLELQKRVWQSVRKKVAGGGYSWISERSDTTVDTCAVKTRKDVVNCDFKIAKAGYYTLRGMSTDAAGRKVETSTSMYAYGGGYSWWGNSDDERIDVIPDQQKYKVGDTARMLVKSPFRKARALVSIERNGILEQKVLALNGSASTIEVPVTEDMLPNAFVSVVLIRGRLDDAPDDGTTIDPGKPAFKAGYATVTVDRGEKVLDVGIETNAKVYRPGDTVRAKVLLKDFAGNPTAGEVTFMAVDEGVLSLTGYRTPNPIEVFYRKRSLSVLMAESRKAVIAKVDAAEEDGDKGDDGGGGEGGGGAPANYRAAFATTATFIPTLKVGADGFADLEFKLPDNLTAFRLMAVAVGADNRFGSTDTRIQVQKPLIVRPALPRFNATGDTFDVRAVVQTVGDHAGEVELVAEVSGPVELVGAQRQVVTLAPGQSKEVSFPARVGAPGMATFKFRAKAISGFQASDAVKLDLPVKYPAVTRRLVETGKVRAVKGNEGSVWKQLTLPRDIRSDVGGLTIEMSSSQLGELVPGLQYLMGYPYGCVEQTTGKTLPLVAMQLLLGEVQLPGISQAQSLEYAQAGVDRLFTMQTWAGGLGYWPGADEVHPWGTVYGGLALVQASRVKGLNVDQDKLDRLLGYLREMVRGETTSPDWYSTGAATNTEAFAAYLLAVAGEPEPSAMTRLFERRKDLNPFGKALLSLALLQGGGEPSMAETLLGELTSTMYEDGAMASISTEGFDQLDEIMDSDVRTNALGLMALHRAQPGSALVDKLARGLLERRSAGRWINTQDNAFAVLGLMDYFHAQEKDAPNFTAAVGLGGELMGEERFARRGMDVRTVHIPMQKLKGMDGQTLTLLRDGPRGTLHYTMRLEYVESNPPTTPYDGGFTLRREYIAHDGANAGQIVTALKPGQVVQVRLTMVIPVDRHYVAIEDPLPAGLEPINTKFATTAASLTAAADKANAPDWDDWHWWYDHYDFDRIEQRDDRVLLFADYFPQGVYTHTYLARATTPGSYTVPSARVEEMYKPNVFGRTGSFKLEVR